LRTGTSGQSVLARVDRELRALLGRVPKQGSPSNVKNFVSSLTKAITLTEDEGGYVKWSFNGGSVGIAEFGEGGLSATQAILSNRASPALGEARTIIERLTPVLPNPDLELVEALRDRAELDINDLADELAREPSLRAPRVSRLFDSLEITNG